MIFTRIDCRRAAPRPAYTGPALRNLVFPKLCLLNRKMETTLKRLELGSTVPPDRALNMSVLVTPSLLGAQVPPLGGPQPFAARQLLGAVGAAPLRALRVQAMGRRCARQILLLRCCNAKEFPLRGPCAQGEICSLCWCGEI
jgi:hypothetical protein